MSSVSISEVFNKLSSSSAHVHGISTKLNSIPLQKARKQSFCASLRKQGVSSTKGFTHTTSLKPLPRTAVKRLLRERRQRAELDFVCVENGVVPKEMEEELQRTAANAGEFDDWEAGQGNEVTEDEVTIDTTAETEELKEEEQEEEEEEENKEEIAEELLLEPKPDMFAIKELVGELTDRTYLGKRGEGLFLAKIFAFGLILFPPLNIESLTFVAGLLIMFSGASTAVYAVMNLGKAISPFLAPRKNSELRQSGVYGYVRHPMYAGLLLFSLGLAITTRNELRLILTCALWWIMEKLLKFEEKKLAEKFGEEYVEYKNKVKSKFVPGVY